MLPRVYNICSSRAVTDRSADKIHADGTKHIIDRVFGEGDQAGQGTATSAENSKPEPVATPKPPASNPGADDPTGGIPKDAGGVSVAAHVGSPTTGKEKRKSIIGQLKGLFLGGDKEREASEAGTATQGGTSTAAVAAGATGTGVAAGQAVDLPDRTKSDAADKSTMQQVKEAVTGNKEANTGTTAAALTETKQETNDTKMEESKEAPKEESTEEPKSTSEDNENKAPAPSQSGGRQLEHRDAIPTAGGERLGDKHWGESKIVPDNPAAKKAEESSGQGVSSAEGQPTGESKSSQSPVRPVLTCIPEQVKDNTAKNTGGASGGPQGQSGAQSPASGEKKGKFMDKVKDKLHIGKKDNE